MTARRKSTPQAQPVRLEPAEARAILRTAWAERRAAREPGIEALLDAAARDAQAALDRGDAEGAGEIAAEISSVRRLRRDGALFEQVALALLQARASELARVKDMDAAELAADVAERAELIVRALRVQQMLAGVIDAVDL